MHARVGLILALGVLASASAPVAWAADPVVAVAALPIDQASAALKELPTGEYKMVFVHPYTCCPVEVCFCLPCGCYDVKCGSGCCAKKLVFNYPGLKDDVVIKFKKDGSVAVKD